jgi:hypothetical protein
MPFPTGSSFREIGEIDFIYFIFFVFQFDRGKQKTQIFLYGIMY